MKTIHKFLTLLIVLLSAATGAGAQTKYDLTIGESLYGTVAFTVSGKSATQAAAGDIVTVTVTPNDGYAVKELTARAKTTWGSAKTRSDAPGLLGDITLTAGSAAGTWTFTMPKANVRVVATYTRVLQDSWIQAIPDVTYTGSEQKPTITVKDGSTTLTEETDYTVSYSNNVNAGTATVTITAATSSDKYSGSAKGTFIIKKATPTVTAPTAKTGLVYSCNAQTLITAGSTDTGTMQYSLDGTNYSTDLPTATDAGTYTVYYKVVVGNDNYNDVAAKTISVSVAKATPIVTDPIANTLIYIGKAQELVFDGETTGGTMQYSLDGKTYATTIPEATNAGEYTVYYKVVGGINYNDVAAKTVKVTIDKATPDDVFAPMAKNLFYSGSAQTLITAGTTSGGTMQYSLDGETYSTTLPTATDAGEYTVYYKVVGGNNYNDVAAKTVKVTIDKGGISVAFPTTNILIYSGQAQELVEAGMTSGGTMQYSLDGETYSDKVPTAIDAGEYTVYFRVVGGANYDDMAAKTINVTIGKATPSVTAPKANTLTYTGSAQTLVTAGTTSGGTMLYSHGDETYTTTLPTATDAGEYIVYYKVVGDSNYEDVDVAIKPINVTIAKATPTVTAPTAKALTYTGQSYQLVFDGETSGGEMLYSLDGENYAAAIPEATDAGEYTVYYKVVGGDNYNDVAAKTVKVTIEANPNMFEEDGVGFIKQEGNTVALVGDEEIKGSYEIPATVDYDGVTYEVTAIAAEAFEDNTGITQLTIPASITSIGASAFKGCTGLEAIYCYNPTPVDLSSAARTRGSSISVSQFEGVDKETCILYVPYGSGKVYASAVGWSEFEHIVEMRSPLDLNNDGTVDDKDVEMLAEAIMSTSTGYDSKLDINNDHVVNAADIVELVNFIKAHR